jgi:hypothetical protein
MYSYCDQKAHKTRQTGQIDLICGRGPVRSGIRGGSEFMHLLPQGWILLGQNQYDKKSRSSEVPEEHHA